MYLICIEDLLINLNKRIKGYSLNIVVNLQIKNKAYANDVTCFTKDEESIIEIFNESERWVIFLVSLLIKIKFKY